MTAPVTDFLPPDPSELLDLFSVVRDETATPEQFHRLEDVLRVDDESVALFVRLMRVHALFERDFEILAESDVESPFPRNTETRVNSEHQVHSPLHSPLSTCYSSGWPIAYLIATVVFAIGLAIGAIVHVSQPGKYASPCNSIRVPNPQSPIPTPSSVVARVTGMADCQWAAAAPRAYNDAPVLLGQKYNLVSGLMEITYATGAKVILQGPVLYEAESRNGGFLSSGKLTGKVEVEDAKGFVIHTPTATITDLGTEFCVEVHRDQREDVVVLQGQVRLTTRIGENAELLTRNLSAGEAARISANGATTIAPAASSDLAGRFARALQTPPISTSVGIGGLSGLVLWLKADAIRRVSDGDTIGVWPDSSDGSNHMYHITETCPVYISGANAGLNNMPVVRFQGTEQLRGTLDANPRTPGVQALTSPFTLFSVVKSAADASKEHICGYFGGGLGRLAFGVNPGTYPPMNSFWICTPQKFASYGKANSLNANWNIHAYLIPDMTPQHWMWYFNGAAIGHAGFDSYTPPPFDDQVFLGSTGSNDEYWKGDIAELLVFNRVLGESDLHKVNDYLAKKYGIETAWKGARPARTP